MPDGAWFVGLDALDDSNQVGPAIARTLGLFDGTLGQAVDALPGFLAERSMLLVLDNFEHVLDASAIVASAPAQLARLALHRGESVAAAPQRRAGVPRPARCRTVTDEAE